jgi:hypothetical protein
MPFDVRMPDGTLLRNIPDGTTKEQIAEKYGMVSKPPEPVQQAPEMPEPEVQEPVEDDPFQEPESAPIEPIQDAPALEAEPFEEPETPTDLSDFGVTPEMQRAAPEPEVPERSYTQQYNDETVRQGKQRVNEDGTVSTVLSTTGELDGKWYNVPGFDRDTGKDYESDDAAIEAARADIEAGKVTPYATAEEAIAAATEEHKELEEPVFGDRSFEGDQIRTESTGMFKDLTSRVKKGFVEGAGGGLKGLSTIDQIFKDQDELNKFIRKEFKDKEGEQYEYLREFASDERSTLEKIKGTDFYKAGQKLIDYSKEEYETNPEYDELFISKAAQGLGSMAIFMATTLVHPVAGAFAGAGMNADSQFEDSIRLGASFEDSMKAAKVGALFGLTEVAPIEYAFSRINRATGGWFSRTVTDKIKSKIGQIGVEATIGGLGEYIQEALMEFANNWSAKSIVGYDKERNLWEGVNEAGEVGGVLGFLLTTITSAFGVRKRGKLSEAADSIDMDENPLLPNSKYRSPFQNDLDELLEGREGATQPSDLPIERMDSAQAAIDLLEDIKSDNPNATRFARNLLRQIERDQADFIKLMKIAENMEKQEEYEKKFIALHNLALGDKIETLRELSKDFEAPKFDEAINLIENEITSKNVGVITPDDEEAVPSIEDADPREVIRRAPHSELMNNPVYKRYYDASDIGELSDSHEKRVEAAKEAYIRKAEKIKKWKPIIEEVEQKQVEAAAEEEPVGADAAIEEREEFEEEKAEEPLLPEDFDASEEVYTNIDGEETTYPIQEASDMVEMFDKNEETSPISREERDQMAEQLDEYRQRYDEQESLESPRSEAREERDLKLPSTVQELSADSLELQPKLMQYKSKTDRETGRNKQLEGIKKFDPAKAGVVIVWQDAAGKNIVADGHQRVNLLKELQSQGKDMDTKVLSRVYREDEGYTAKDVRTIAAGINIAQGTGSAVDAAKVLRDLSEQEYNEVMAVMPVNSSLVRDAKGLAKLGEEAFQVVVNELIEPKYGAMVGEAFEEAEQTAAMQILIKAKPDTFSEAYAMIADIQAGGFVESEQGGLFGEVEMESLIKERAEILSTAESGLRKNARIFKALTKEEKRITEAGENVLDTETNKAIAQEAGSLIDSALRTINTNPELNNELNSIAKRYKSGEITRKQAANEFIETAKSYSERDSGGATVKPGVETAGKKQEEKPEKDAEKEGKTAKTAKKKPSQITLKEEKIDKETGEKETVTQNAAQALLRINKRIDVMKKIRDCVTS